MLILIAAPLFLIFTLSSTWLVCWGIGGPRQFKIAWGLSILYLWVFAYVIIEAWP